MLFFRVPRRRLPRRRRRLARARRGGREPAVVEAGADHQRRVPDGLLHPAAVLLHSGATGAGRAAAQGHRVPQEPGGAARRRLPPRAATHPVLVEKLAQQDADRAGHQHHHAAAAGRGRRLVIVGRRNARRILHFARDPAGVRLRGGGGRRRHAASTPREILNWPPAPPPPPPPARLTIFLISRSGKGLEFYNNHHRFAAGKVIVRINHVTEFSR
jgi:hypothetical protein